MYSIFLWNLYLMYVENADIFMKMKMEAAAWMDAHASQQPRLTDINELLKKSSLTFRG